MDRRQILKSLPASIAAMALAGHPSAASAVPGANQHPGAMDRRFLGTPEGQLYYWTAGTGPDVVFVHQSGNSSLEYEKLVPFLADRFRMIAVDLPGHGNSDNPTKEPTVDDYAAAVRRVLDHLNVSQAHVVAHHGGCLTAMSLLASEPDRFGKTILSGTGALRSPAENKAFLDDLMSRQEPVRSDKDFMGDLWALYVSFLSDGANVMDMLDPFIAGVDSRQRPYRGIVVNLKWDRRPAAKALKGPVLLVQGTRDSFVSGQETLLDVIPNSERLVMEGLGTFMFYDRAEDCAKMVADYLSR